MSRLTAEELNDEIHDAWIELGNVRQDGDHVVIPGMLERLISRWRLAKFPMEVRIRGLLEAVEDDEAIGKIPVQDVTFQEGVFRLEGAIPGRVVVRSPDGHAELHVAEQPVRGQAMVSVAGSVSPHTC